MNNKIIIAGPCAAESREQVINAGKEMKKRGIKIMRASLWKPRTNPGFDGVGKKGISWLAEVTRTGITVATEVLFPEQVSLVLKIIEKKGNPEKILFWLGARNQNHRIQRLIALKIKKEAPSQVKLLIKNQPWLDEDHWLGIVGHVLGSGISPERVIICHRGFSPNGGENPDKMRNIPNYEMAMGVKKQTGLPMIIDPSHSGGSVANVFKVVKEAKKYRFDGLMVEVHHCPEQAKTDKKQQLTFNELDKLLKKI
jgi:chorismate mutase